MEALTIKSPSGEVRIQLGQRRWLRNRYPWTIEVRGMVATGRGDKQLAQTADAMADRMDSPLGHIAAELTDLARRIRTA